MLRSLVGSEMCIRDRLKCRWSEGNGFEILRCVGQYGRYGEDRHEWDATANRMIQYKLWHDWTGQDVWRKQHSCACAGEDSTEVGSADTWYSPATGAMYAGALDSRGCPTPAGWKQEPWQWRKRRVDMDCIIDHNGHMEATFLPHFTRMGNPDWKASVRLALSVLLQRVDDAIQKPGSQVFRGIYERPTQREHQNTSVLKVLGLCIGIDKYRHLSPLQNCVSDASAMAAAFRNPEQSSHGITATDLEDKYAFLDVLEEELGRLIDQHALTVSTVVVFTACHALQLSGQVYLVPAGAKLHLKKRFEQSVEESCLRLSKVSSVVTAAVDKAKERAMHAHGAYPGRCKCIFILDACRDTGLMAYPSETLDAHKSEGFVTSEQLRETSCDTLFMFSTWQGDYANDVSLYAKTLLANMFVPGRCLGAVQTAAREALKLSGQHPTIGAACIDSLLAVPLFDECGILKVNEGDQLIAKITSRSSPNSTGPETSHSQQRVLALFSTHHKDGPNVRPELRELVAQLGVKSLQQADLISLKPVSYTHLTLPTKRIV
eukprot:TRINITY_DN49661_c0_g1_i1.p1 TRINITY_DN49661_c0_g1~~TRINITY_DN49661_c0_g1_i1.p1  ORF type:complete len:578 (-),score=48.64 TRINITY_DN49661_c0_g1_i1:166-1803(-)